MRLNRLDLTRYGKFTEFSIDFGEKPANSPDLHILYGPNEAGKSTTFAGILDLLYGIEKRSRYGFKHPYNTMQLGGVVELDGKAVPFIRLKRDQQSLFDAHGSPLADATILAELGGIDRTAFQTMFSLDDETLEQGGESILASRGELGELLFSASSGLSALSQRLSGLRGDTEQFFKPRGQSHELAQYKRDLEALKAQGDALDVAASAYTKLIEARDVANARYEAAADTLAVNRAALDRLQKTVRAYPKYRSLVDLRSQLAPLRDIPDAPAAWDQAAREIQLETAKLETAARLNANERDNVKAERAAITVNTALLELAEDFDSLVDLRARFVTAEKDLPARRSNKAAIDGAIGAILRRLERSEECDPADLILKPAIRGQLDDLIAERGQIDEQLRLAEAEYERAKRELADAEASLSAAGAPSVPLPDTVRHRLMSALDAVRTSDHVARKRLADSEVKETSGLLDTQRLLLDPWTGDAKALATLTVPSPDQIAHWRTEASELESERKRLATEIARLEEVERKAAAELSVLHHIDGLVTDGDAQRLRRERETAWQSHRSSLTPASADAFEAAMRRDDEIGATRLSHVSSLARINELSARKALATTELASQRERMKELGAQQAALQTAVSAVIVAMSSSLPPEWTLERVDTWLSNRLTVLATWSAMQKASERRDDAEADGQRLTDALRDALSIALPTITNTASPDLLVMTAEACIESDTRLRANSEALLRLRRDRETREGTLASAKNALELWIGQWQQTCTSCWLGDGVDLPAASVVRRIFGELEQLAADIKTQGELAYRIKAMEHDQKTYAERVGDFARRAGFTAGLPAFETDKALASAIAGAKTLSQAAAHAEARLTALESDAARIDSDQATLTARLKIMCDHFEITSLADLLAMLAELTTRRHLQAQADVLERDICDTLETGTIADAEAHLAVFDPDAARLEIAQATIALENDEVRIRDLYAEKCRTSDSVEAVDGDDVVARIEEQKRTLLLQVEDSALTWLKLKLGIAATERALALFREQHRSSLLVRASESFRLVSRNAYTRLSTQADKDGEVLVAITADGASKRASELSKGTRFQLYLALRVAGYQELLERRKPVPFIADDILETFDDFRAEETLKVFCQMANSGQVIYLTHHKHLCDIARDVCPSVKIHDLQAASHDALLIPG